VNDSLTRARYINLATFRRSGVAVETPVWFAEIEDRYYVFSAGNAGKVKRLRNSSRARVAPCDMRGKVLGSWQDADAVLIREEETIRKAHRALRRKYGWQMILTDWLSRLTGRFARRAYIAITLLPAEGAGRQEEPRA
jgi:PPOX class probable F420-dependent enzyme